MTVERVPLFKPLISEEAIEAVGEVLRSGWIGLGPRTAEFESAFARYVGAQQSVAVNSCTAALHLALVLADVSPGDEVITTALTFVASNHVILYEGATPVFADVQRDTGNLDIASVEERITDKTKAIVAVHFGGYPCDLDELYAIERSTGIRVIEDCAHACGSAYKGARIGSHGSLHAFSFHAVKNLPCGDGGALTLSSEEDGARARRLRWFGIDRSTFERARGDTYSWDYDVNEVGFKYHMNDIAAAIALAQLKLVDEQNERRREIATKYRRRLANVPGIQLLRADNDRVNSYHLFCLLADRRDSLMKKLQDHGIDSGMHYKRNDLYPMYDKQELAETERFWTRAVSLPMHMHLTDSDIERVCDVIENGW